MASGAERLLRAYATQLEALRRLRHGGSQPLRVEHVHGVSQVPELCSDGSGPSLERGQNHELRCVMCAVFYDCLPLRLAALRPVRQRKERNMWKVGDVEPVRVMGAEAIRTDSTLPPKTASRLFHLLMHLGPLPRQRQHIWNRLC